MGTPEAPKAGLPKVEVAKDGTPTITIPDTKAPTGLEIAVLKQGDGADRALTVTRCFTQYRACGGGHNEELRLQLV